MTELKDVKPGVEVTLPIDWIRALTFGRSGYEVAKLEPARNRAGRTAGTVLALVLIMERAGHDRPSINKAVRLIEDLPASVRKETNAIELYSGRKEILAAWNLMRDAAHFWAALEFFGIPAVAQKYPAAPDQMAAFLRLAAAFRQFGCSHRESNTATKKPIMDADTAWQLPDYIEKEAIPFGTIPLPPRMQEILKRYRAPKSFT